MKISALYFKFIKDKHLENTGVTSSELAKRLVEHGFLDYLSKEDVEWTQKATSGEFTKEFWKVIDSTKPTRSI